MPPTKSNVLQTAIRIAPLGELNAYIVNEHELDLLAQGSPGSNFLNLAYALFSASISLTVAILGTDIPSNRVFNVFVIFAVLTGMFGVICLILWKQSYRSNKDLVEQIKNRMPPPIGTPAAPLTSAS